VIRYYCDNPSCRTELLASELEHARSIEVAPGASIFVKVVVTGGHFCLKCILGLLKREIHD
jgi:hypothetical protein